MTKWALGIVIVAAFVVAAIGLMYSESLTQTAEAAKPASIAGRVSVTTDVGTAPIFPFAAGGVSVLLDVTGSGTLKDVHVAATLPCAGTSSPPAGGLVIVTGIAGVTIPPGIPIISTAADNTGFPGVTVGTCVFHGTVSGLTGGETDVVLINTGGVPLAFGTIVTVTATYT